MLDWRLTWLDCRLSAAGLVKDGCRDTVLEVAAEGPAAAAKPFPPLDWRLIWLLCWLSSAGLLKDDCFNTTLEDSGGALASGAKLWELNSGLSIGLVLKLAVLLTPCDG